LSIHAASKTAVPAKAGTHLSDARKPDPWAPAFAGDAGCDGCETIGGAVHAASSALTVAGFDEPRRRARRILAAALDIAPTEILGHPERSLTAAQQARIADFQSRMLAHEPLSRIVGHREFWGLDFQLSADTLDPRPDSETLIEAVLARWPNRQAPLRVLDLGCGTGCLLLALLSEYPEARGYGVDVAPGAAQTARENAARLGFTDRACFAVGSWAAGLRGPFDVVVANPPYIASDQLVSLPAEVRDYDPHRALDGGADGLAAYRAIATDLPRLLAPGAIFAAEIGEGQSTAAATMLKDAGLIIDSIQPDLAGIDRVVVARRAHV
jgi:release factor glutamine methyltransferase